jgi:hypothetical protein
MIKDVRAAAQDKAVMVFEYGRYKDLSQMLDMAAIRNTAVPPKALWRIFECRRTHAWPNGLENS